jgi:type I restriction enzyme S subunit
VENLLQERAGKTKSERVPSDGNSIEFCNNDVLIGNIRPYLKKIWLADCNGGTNGDVLVVRSKSTDVLCPQFMYFVLASDAFFEYDNSHAKGAKMPRGDKRAVMDYTFFLPSLKEQNRIVEILDQFDKLCNDLSDGIPAEIEARKKQYEFYRDKLLSFKEVET